MRQSHRKWPSTPRSWWARKGLGSSVQKCTRGSSLFRCSDTNLWKETRHSLGTEGLRKWKVHLICLFPPGLLAYLSSLVFSHPAPTLTITKHNSSKLIRFSANLFLTTIFSSLQTDIAVKVNLWLIFLQSTESGTSLLLVWPTHSVTLYISGLLGRPYEFKTE